MANYTNGTFLEKEVHYNMILLAHHHTHLSAEQVLEQGSQLQSLPKEGVRAHNRQVLFINNRHHVTNTATNYCISIVAK